LRNRLSQTGQDLQAELIGEYKRREPIRTLINQC
jgi:hypothetical protein